jgi:uncharacterized protein (DUF4415 family)
MRTGRKTAESVTPAGTDWARVRREAAADAPIAYDPATDTSVEPYDPNDAAAVAAHWSTASIKRGPGRPKAPTVRPTLNMRVDADVLAAFKATGPGWQTRINELLREALDSGRIKS